MNRTNHIKLIDVIKMFTISIFFTVVSILIILNLFPFNQTATYIIGFGLILVGLMGLFSYFSIRFISHKNDLRILFPAIIFFSTGIPFLINQMNILDFFLYIGLGIGLNFLIAGINLKLLGFLIPGSIILGVMPGLYFAWEDSTATNALEQTGVMLVWFALGWGLITILSRALTRNFVWWPLIPGGILAVVGWGLFIAGNPGSAIGFIGNTGSIGLIIFGIYILLMRRSFHK